MNAMSRREAARHIRLQIQARVAEGELPDAQYTVRCKEDKIVLYVNAPDHLKLEPHGRYQRYDEIGRHLLARLDELVAQYQGEVDGQLNYRARVEVIRAMDFDGGI